MSYIVIMGMQFEEGSEPDFGSIYRSKEGQNGVHEYGLQAADVSKLDLITNAAAGSTALCDDSLALYRLSKSGEWQEIGGNSDTWAAGIIEGTATHVYNANVTKIAKYVFCENEIIESADFPNANEVKRSAFESCQNLSEINLPNVTTISYQSFSATALVSVNLPKVKTLGSSSFAGCQNLETADFGALEGIGGAAFQASNITTLIIRTDSVATLGSYVFLNTPIASGTGYIYVPDDLVDSYKAASGWSTYAEQIKGLSELPSEEEES